MLAWLEQHQSQIIWTTAVSVACFLVSMLVAGVVMVRLPADYFGEAGQQRRKNASTAWRITRNVLGWVLIVAGAVMLALPGQGMIVLLIGVMLADFPGKHRLEEWIISRRRVNKAINSLRRRFGREPLEVPRKQATPLSA